MQYFYPLSAQRYFSLGFMALERILYLTCGMRKGLVRQVKQRFLSVRSSILIFRAASVRGRKKVSNDGTYLTRCGCRFAQQQGRQVAGP